MSNYTPSMIAALEAAAPLTLEIAKRFGARSMLGVDIDEALVERATRLAQTSSSSHGPGAADVSRGQEADAVCGRERTAAPSTTSHLAESTRPDAMAARASEQGTAIGAARPCEWASVGMTNDDFRALFLMPSRVNAECMHAQTSCCRRCFTFSHTRWPRADNDTPR